MFEDPLILTLIADFLEAACVLDALSKETRRLRMEYGKYRVRLQDESQDFAWIQRRIRDVKRQVCLVIRKGVSSTPDEFGNSLSDVCIGLLSSAAEVELHDVENTNLLNKSKRYLSCKVSFFTNHYTVIRSRRETLRALILFDLEQDTSFDYNTLKHLYSIEHLNLNTATNLNNVDWITGMTRLKQLFIYSSSVKTIQPLAKLDRLEHLQMPWCLIESAPLQQLRFLKTLDISSNNFAGQGLTDISSLHRLTSLDISDTSVHSLDILAGLNLYHLWANGLPVTDWKSIQHLTKLKTLSIKRCQAVADWSFLQCRSALEELHISSITLQHDDLSFITHAISLRTLNMSHCYSIAHLEPLKGLNRLEWLKVAFCSLTNIEALVSLYSLKYLHIGNLLLEDLSVIARLRHLQDLRISSVRHVDLIFTRHILSLRSLSIIDIESISSGFATTSIDNFSSFSLWTCL
jgi:hypothetical protein